MGSRYLNTLPCQDIAKQTSIEKVIVEVICDMLVKVLYFFAPVLHIGIGRHYLELGEK